MSSGFHIFRIFVRLTAPACYHDVNLRTILPKTCKTHAATFAPVPSSNRPTNLVVQPGCADLCKSLDLVAELQLTRQGPVVDADRQQGEAHLENEVEPGEAKQELLCYGCPHASWCSRHWRHAPRLSHTHAAQSWSLRSKHTLAHVLALLGYLSVLATEEHLRFSGCEAFQPCGASAWPIGLTNAVHQAVRTNGRMLVFVWRHPPQPFPDCSKTMHYKTSMRR